MNIRTSPLVEAVATAQRRPGLAVVWLVGYGAAIVGVRAVVGPVVRVLLGQPEAGSAQAQLVDLGTGVGTLAVLALWVGLWERRPVWTVGFLGSGGVSRFFVGVVGGVALLAAPLTVLMAAGQYGYGAPGYTTTGLAALRAVVVLIPVWMVQAAAQEAVWRGYLLQWHGARLPGWVAIAVPSAGFALVHLDFHPWVLVNLTLVAVFASFVCLAQGSIWLAAGIQAGWSLAEGNVFGVPLGGSRYDVSIFALGPMRTAPDWLTGGPLGLSGSAVTSAVLAVATLIAFWYYCAVEAARQPMAEVGAAGSGQNPLGERAASATGFPSGSAT